MPATTNPALPKILDQLPLAEELFALWAPELGADATGYRNHVYRVLNFTCALCPAKDEALEQLIVAGVYHDLGIWTDHTFDYLEPSVARATTWLQEHGHAEWVPVVNTIIRNHHKITSYRGDHAPLVEAFRRADLADVSLGTIRPGLARVHVKAVRRHFPNAGFHKRLLQLAGRQLLRQPWRPMPMMRW